MGNYSGISRERSFGFDIISRTLNIKKIRSYTAFAAPYFLFL